MKKRKKKDIVVEENNTVEEELKEEVKEEKPKKEKKHKEKKEKKVKEVKKHNIILFLFWFLIILFLEASFKLIMGISFTLNSIINITLYSLMVSCILSFLSSVFPVKANRVIIPILLFILGLLFNVELVFHKIFKTYFSLTNLGLGDQAASFIKDALIGIFTNIHFILILLAPFIIYLFVKKRFEFKRISIKSAIAYILILASSIGLFYLHMDMTKKDTNSTYYLYNKVNEMALSIDNLGVLNAYGLDFYRLIFGFEQELEVEKHPESLIDNTDLNIEIVYDPNKLDLNFDKATNNSEIQKINSYVSSDKGTLQNEYTGKFKDYNLIYITAESFSDIAVDEEITPTLYKLTHSGFILNNFYNPYVLSTIGGEFQSLTGLYPDNTILTTWRSGNNYFPYGLATVFKGQNYNTYAYHNNSYVFQDRHKYLQSQGFDNFLACYNGLEKRMNCKLWPQSDEEMMKVTLDDYINSDKPFLAYYMTVSGHFQYNFKGDNSMCKRHQSEVANWKGDTSAKAYMATQIELDRALKVLIDALEEKGKLDKTVFVLMGDHYPYALSVSSINSIASYEKDGTVEVNHSNLILWNSAMEDVTIDKVAMSADVLPTVLNLFGIEYDSRLLTGRDILSDTEGLAVLKNRSWVTNKGTYFAANGSFVAKDGVTVEDGYVDNINSIVSNRLNISRLIVKNDYYSYLLR